jgi:hypothetical protein
VFECLLLSGVVASCMPLVGGGAYICMIL